MQLINRERLVFPFVTTVVLKARKPYDSTVSLHYVTTGIYPIRGNAK